MPDPILSTKLYIYPPPPKIVLRKRLIDRLNDGLHRKLTLVSAPAGFGKTTLISEWVADCGRPVAWLSLDAQDNNFNRFLTYFIAAMQTIHPNIGFGVQALLEFPQPHVIDTILSILINEISSFPNKFIFVLDDYHKLDSKPVDEALTFLLEHLPAQMHIVITTREDPSFPLARLRSRNQLSELRVSALRFTHTEAAEFLNQVIGLNLSDENIAALENRTEGWIAGLQLAALSMQGKSDTAGFIKSFTGSHHFVLDYLVEEVLQQQSVRVRNFLLQTAILDRFCGSLCDAVTTQEGSRDMLDELERGNLFVIPLDERRQWYRYHHLFADVLQTHLMEEQPNQVSDLHRRACEWYEKNDLRPEAIVHSLAARDYDRAASLIELARPAMDLSFQSKMWLEWAKALPDEIVRDRPVLSYSYASALLDIGEIEAAEARLQEAERWLETPSIGTSPKQRRKMIVVDEERFRSLPASIAASRAYLAQTLGDIPGSVKFAELALELTSEEDLINRIQATALLGLAYWASGNLIAANRVFSNLTKNMLTTGNISVATGTTFVLANIRVAMGNLHEAFSAYEQTLQLAVQSEPMPVGTADLYRGLSELYCERGDLEAASQTLARSKELGEQAASTDWLHRLFVAQARMKQIQGDLDGALSLLDEAEHLLVRDPLPDVHPVTALKARIWITQGKLNKVMSWTHERGLSIDDNLSYLREFEHITLARTLIAQYMKDRIDAAIHEALGLLKRLLQEAEEGIRTGSKIEILTLQAIAYNAQDDLDSALVALECALILAEPEGYVRIFVDEGIPMAELLKEAAKHGIAPNYINLLQGAFRKTKVGAAITQQLIEPLSEREMEVLKLLRTELSGPEIASHMIISINTLRTHTKNIFNKLGVNNRREAVRLTEEHNLF